MTSKFYSTASYRFKHFFGLEQPEDKSFFGKLFGSEKKQHSFFSFGKAKSGASWPDWTNPWQRSKKALIVFAAKVLALVIILKLSWSTLKSFAYLPIAWLSTPSRQEVTTPVMAGTIDARTQLELKQVELELHKLKLEIEKEKARNAAKR